MPVVVNGTRQSVRQMLGQWKSSDEKLFNLERWKSCFKCHRSSSCMRHKFHVKSSSGVLKNFFPSFVTWRGKKMSRNERFPQDIFKASLCQMKYFHHNFPPSLKLSMAENIFAHFTDEMFNFPSNHQSGCFSKRKNCLRTRRGCAWDTFLFFITCTSLRSSKWVSTVALEIQYIH